MPLLAACFQILEFAWGAIISTFSNAILSIFTLAIHLKITFFSRAYGAISASIEYPNPKFSRAYGAIFASIQQNFRSRLRRV